RCVNGVVTLPQGPGTDETIVETGTPLSPETSGGRFLAIYEIGRQLLAQKEPAQVIRAVHGAIVENLRPDHACVLALGADGSYRPLAAHAMDLSGPQEGWPLSHTVLRKAREGGVAVLASDVQRDSAFEEAGSVHRLRIRSLMCVPLGEKVVKGLIYLDNRDERAFGREDLEFLRAASLYASLILARTEEWVLASETLQAQGERLELLQEELLRHEIVGRAPALVTAFDVVKRLARSGARVLLRGETGTGKELFARAY